MPTDRSVLNKLASAAVCVVVIGLVPIAQAEEFKRDPGRSYDLSWLPRIPGAELSSREQLDYGLARIPLKPVQNYKDSSSYAEVEGPMSLHCYHPLPQQLSPLHMLKSYRQSLEKAGYSIVYECKSEKDCGKGYGLFLTSITNTHADFNCRNTSMDAALTAKRKLRSGQQWVHIGIDGYKDKAVWQIVAQDGDAVNVVPEISPGTLSAGLASAGSVVVPGIYFDSDKAVVKAESKAALEAMAGLLRQQPGLSIYVVGHTDDSGSLEHNLLLSQQRAEAVKAALVRQYGISAGRLEARGVGPLAPEATNTTDEGRTRNRRVVIAARLVNSP